MKSRPDRAARQLIGLDAGKRLARDRERLE